MIKKSIYFGILFFLVIVISISAYKQMTKTCKSQRLECHKQVTVFEKIYNKNKLGLLKSKINEGSIHFSFNIEKAKYTPSKLFEAIDPKVIEAQIKTQFGCQNSDQEVKLDVLVYENDKLDPGKKNDDAKKYAGYLVFDFYVGNEKIYKIQIDFMDMKGKDIPRAILCAKNSIQSL